MGEPDSPTSDHDQAPLLIRQYTTKLDALACFNVSVPDEVDVTAGSESGLVLSRVALHSSVDNQPRAVVPFISGRRRWATWRKLAGCGFAIHKMYAPLDPDFCIGNQFTHHGFFTKFVAPKFINPKPSGLRFDFSWRRLVAVRPLRNNPWGLRAKEISGVAVS
jgi:hypothetical protein